MATVPTYDQLQASTSIKPLASAQSSDYQNHTAARIQRQGQTMQQFGGAVSAIETEIQNRANDNRIKEADSQLVEIDQQLEYGKQGYTKLRGRDALERPNRQSLADEYGAQFDKAAAGISKGLGNDAQRQVFADVVARRRASLTSRVMRHADKEHQTYAVGVQEGAIKVSRNQMALSWGDPDVTAGAAASIKAAVVERGHLVGLSGEQIKANIIDELSPAHAAVITSAVDAGKVDYAKSYLKANNAELTPAARIALKKTIQTGDLIGQAQDKTDSIMASNKTPTEKISAARGIDDPKLRDHVVSRVKARVSEARTLEQQANNDHLQQAYDLIANRQEIPASLLSNIHGTNKLNLLELQAQGGTPSRDNLTAYAGLKSLPADQLTIEKVMKFAPFLTPNTMKKFIDMATNPSEQEKSLISNSARISNSIKALSLDAKKQGVLYKQIETWQQQLGHTPTHKELGDYLDFIQKEVLTDDGFVYDSHEKVANIRVDGVPTEQIPGIVKALAAANKPASDANILKVFERLSTQ